MYKHIIELADGTRITSGSSEIYAIKSVSIQERVNSGSELTLGSTCASQVQVELFAPDNGLNLVPSEEIKVYEQKDFESNISLVGTFIIEQPKRASANTIKITAYDRITKLDKDVTEWLNALNEWPYTLYQFVQMVCAECSVFFATDSIPNGDYLVQKFWAENITGRNLIEWAGQAAGRFCRSTPQGDLEFAWYVPTEYSIGASLDAQNDLFYFQNSLSFEEYSVEPIERVHIQLTEDDIGVAHPSSMEDLNTYAITGNYLLTTDSTQALQPVATTLYEHLKNVTYTPCTISIPANPYIRAGNIVTICDRNGFSFNTYVMSRTRQGQKDTLSCTGSHRRDSASVAAAKNIVKALQGRVAKLRVSLEEVSVSLQRTTEEIDSIQIEQSSIAQTVQGIDTRVTEQKILAGELQGKQTELEQRADSLSISVTTIQSTVDSKASQSDLNEIAEHFNFDADGLTISNTNTGMGIQVSEKQVAFQGSGNPSTIIRPHDMSTTNLSVETRLDLGGFSFIPRTNKNLSLRWTGGDS